MPQSSLRNEVISHFNDIEAGEKFHISPRARRAV